MSLTAKQPEGSNIDPVPADNYHAVCYSVVDLGTQRNEYYDKNIHQIVITWEIPSLRIEIVKDNIKQNLPRVISKTYTLSLGEKAHLYNDLISWRGKVFTPEELEGFDVGAVVRANCLLQVVHNTNKKGDKTYANVAAVTKLVKGMEVFEPENPVVTYNMTEDGYDPPDTIPQWIRDIIKKSTEYKAVHSAQENPDLASAQQAYDATEDAAARRQQDDSDIPF